MGRRPNGKNVEIALQLLQLSLALKSAVKKANRIELIPERPVREVRGQFKGIALNPGRDEDRVIPVARRRSRR